MKEIDRLRNPFAVQNGSVIMIEDLSLRERGLNCHCKCPACNGDFIARMGDIKIHHFAHSKDACDEALSYTSGLYRLIHQILGGGIPFYIPALVIAYTIPNDVLLDENNIGSHIEFVREGYNRRNSILVSAGRYIAFESAELCVDRKNQIQALELTYMNSKIAIKVMPPDTVCKKTSVSPHKDMATLALNFTDDADKIQTSNSKMFQEYLLSEHLDKRWVSNPKVRKAYPDLFALSQKTYRDYEEREKKLSESRMLAARQLEEARKLAARQFEEARMSTLRQQIACCETTEKTIQKTIQKSAPVRLNQKQIHKAGYKEVKDKFVQQTDPIRDSFHNRWIQCEECGEIKRDTEFWSYGGLNHVNLGHCNACDIKRRRNRLDL